MFQNTPATMSERPVVLSNQGFTFVDGAKIPPPTTPSRIETTPIVQPVTPGEERDSATGTVDPKIKTVKCEEVSKAAAVEVLSSSLRKANEKSSQSEKDHLKVSGTNKIRKRRGPKNSSSQYRG